MRPSTSRNGLRTSGRTISQARANQSVTLATDDHWYPSRRPRRHSPWDTRNSPRNAALPTT